MCLIPHYDLHFLHIERIQHNFLRYIAFTLNSFVNHQNPLNYQYFEERLKMRSFCTTGGTKEILIYFSTSCLVQAHVHSCLTRFAYMFNLDKIDKQHHSITHPRKLTMTIPLFSLGRQSWPTRIL